MSKEILGVRIIMDGKFLCTDVTLPTDEEIFSHVMGQYDVTKEECIELIERFKKLSKDVDLITGVR